MAQAKRRDVSEESGSEDFEKIATEEKAKLLLLYEMTSNGTVQFDELLLDRLTARIGDHQLAIISTAGKSRGGKTFWLNFLLKGLREGDTSFSNHENIGGYDGIPFKNGQAPDTKGIHVWSEVFFQKGKNGEKIAVLIVDVQGTFDTESDMDQSINYFAVSLLLSSIQVFNSRSTLDLQDFDALNQFIAYSNVSGEHVGQHMFFLIRDAPDGKGLDPQYLVTIKEGSQKAARTHELIDGVMRAFLKTECFLVPFPDRKLFNATIEIKAQDVGRECLTSLATAANHLLENLEPKTVQGVVMTGNTFNSYARDVFSKMKSKGRNKIGTLFDAMKTIAFEEAKKAGKAAFKDGWNQFHQRHNFQPITPRNFAAEEKSIMEQAKNAYLNVICYGSEELRKEHFDRCLTDLSEKSEDKRLLNEEKYRDGKIATAYEQAVQLYEKEIQPKLFDGFERRLFGEIRKHHQASYKKAVSLFDKETNEFYLNAEAVGLKRDKLIDYLESCSSDVLKECSMQILKEKGRDLCDGAVNEYRDLLILKQIEVEDEKDITTLIDDAKTQLTDYILAKKTALLKEAATEFPQLSYDDVDRYLENINDKTLDSMLARAEFDFKMIMQSLLKMKALEKQIKEKEEAQITKSMLMEQEIGLLKYQAESLKEASAKEKEKEVQRLAEAKRKAEEARQKERQAAEEAQKTQQQIAKLQQQLEKTRSDSQAFQETEQRRREEEETRRLNEREAQQAITQKMESKIEMYKQRLTNEINEARKRIAEKPFVLGIDLGTTYSCAAVCVDGKVTVISSDFGKHTTPSQVAFTESEILVGKAAKDQAARNPGNTIYEAKRLIGRMFNDPCVQDDIKHLPFSIVEVKGRPKIKVNNNKKEILYSPLEISSVILKKLKERAEISLDREIKKAVITVPAYFNDLQRNETIAAAKAAGMEVLRIVNEPTAAAIAFGINNLSEEPKTVLIFDFGGGTLDVSIISIKNGVFEVKATSGDTHLGGEDLNNRLFDYLLDELKTKRGIVLNNNKRAMVRLQQAAERAKIELSFNKKAEIVLPSLQLGFDYSTNITRAKFENICNDVFVSSLVPVKRAMDDASVVADQLDEVLLVGGSSRIPKVRKMLSEFLNGKILNTSIDPDEAVAHGAAIQAAKISGDTNETIRKIVFKDVTPLSLGIALNGDLMSVLIPRNSPIPLQKSGKYVTAWDNQTLISVQVYEGERKKASANNGLGAFEIEVPSAKRGTVKILIAFSINENGILEVSAEELWSGTAKGLKIVRDANGLMPGDVEKYLKDAETNQESDIAFELAMRTMLTLQEMTHEMQEATAAKYADLDEAAKKKLRVRGKKELQWTKTHNSERQVVYEHKLAELHAFCGNLLIESATTTLPATTT